MLKTYIKRDIYRSVKEHLSKKEITVLIGPRQCGKTTLLKRLVLDLEKQGKKTLFLNLDLEKDGKYLESQETLMSKIKLEFGNDFAYVFIDEIQKKEKAGVFLKGIYDSGFPCKFVVSGSGNIEIKEKISESLMGRKRLFKMSPLSFEEFVNFKTSYKYKNKLKDFFKLEKLETKNLLFEYLGFGGYPKIVLNTSLQEKQAEIDEIYQSYLNQDIIKWLKVEKIDAFEKIIKILAFRIGNLVDYSFLASSAGISAQTVRNYLWYLEKTFILNKITPFFKNKKKEIVKTPIYYFNDLGLRNFLVNDFGAVNSLSLDIGFVFENFVFNVLQSKIKYSNLKINFWRTKSQAELDFLIDKGGNLIPIEVKFKDFKKPKIEKSLQSFISKYQPQKAYTVNRSFFQEINYKNTKVVFLPFWEIDKIL